MRNKLLISLAVLYIVSSTNLKAADAGYAYCPSGEAYVYLYQSLSTFEIVTKLKCGEKVEIVDPGNNIRVRVRTRDGKEGYVPQSDINATPPGSQLENQQQTSASVTVAPASVTVAPVSAAISKTPDSTSAKGAVWAEKHKIPRGSRVYIETMSGFDTTLAAAFAKKQVPLVIVTDKTQAEYEITGSTAEMKHSTGEKVGMTLLLGMSGAAMSADQMKGSIQIVELRTTAIVYAYTATKGDRAQSVAEACAKHIKNDAIEQ